MLERELALVSSMPRALFDALGVGIAVVEIEHRRILFTNKAFGRMVGMPVSDLEGQGIDFQELTHPDDRAHSAAMYARLTGGDVEEYQIEKRYLKADGGVTWASVTVSALKDSKGVVRWTAASVQDIGAAKVTERQLAAAEEIAGLATWNFAVKDDYAKVSSRYNSLFGMAATAPRPSLQVLLDRVHPEDRNTVAVTIQQAISRKSGYSHEYRIVQPNGETRWMRGIASCLCDAAGNVTNLVGATIDISLERQAASVLVSPVYRLLRDIEENWDQPLSISVLAKRHGMSVRTIHLHFTRLGTSPKRYLKSLRLKHAKQRLSSGKAGNSVSAVALSCGFSNLGHFARDYRAEFGVLPSHTLAIALANASST